ncbi:MAG: cynT [Rickettsiaceae bacterium]|jgi:carbonic anhydrase|nr:cynT [Rickettsiaceae bacterium]
MTDIKALTEGYKRFFVNHFAKERALYNDLAENGQSPKILVIACSDSRVNPATMMDVSPGDMFVIRNVANLVPPYQPKADSYHGTSAALEFAVCYLNVEHIIVLGHSGCGGVRSLFYPPENKHLDFSFIESWMEIAKEARNIIETKYPDLEENEKICHCEKENIMVSIRNLFSFPWVNEREKAGKLKVHGWYWSVLDGSLQQLDGQQQKFIPVKVE